MEGIERLRRERTQIRRLFTRAHNELQQKLEQSSKDGLLGVFKIMEDKAERLFILDEKLHESSFAGDNGYEDEEKEFDIIEEYRDKWITIKSRYESVFHAEAIEIAVSESGRSEGKRNLRLPKLELKCFDGDIRNWLGFWGQFKKIHEDTNLDPEDKFQYLSQAMVPGSAARELVDSFPISEKNYIKAVEQLKARFARDELLIEIYVRELLQLVLQKAGRDMSLVSLFTKLETQLRALETLGVTSDKYAAMLYPLVESTLPVDLLKIWERTRRSQDNGDGDQCNRLEALLKFLSKEVESEERLSLAQTTFNTCQRNVLTYRSNEVLPTASVIHSGEVKQGCIWCDKLSHVSQECFKVTNFTMEQKREILKKKKACFKCIKIGHNSNKCKSNVKCLVCKKSHSTIMCSSLHRSSDSDSKVETERNHEQCKTGSFLSQQRSRTLLQTLIVKVSFGRKEKLVRVLLDSGSQRSYITKEGVSSLGLHKIGEEKLAHNLFGGVETDQQIHGVYNVTLKNLDGTFKCNVTVLDQEKICNFIPRLETQQYYPILQARNIVLTDVGRGVPEVEILLGADVMGQLLTKNIVKLDENVVAQETKLGWTIMGRCMTVNHYNTVVELHCQEKCDISDLWKLDIIGIKDPTDVKTEERQMKDTLEFFEETITTDQNGRYEVRLPWKEGRPSLMNNKDSAEKRLLSVTKGLQNSNKFQEYDQILKQWIDSEIVEIVTNDDHIGYYLPHRGVIKESSSTTKLRPVFDASTKDGRGNSLNACLEKGPNLIERIPELLMNFRKNAIGVSADIAKAFLQINVAKEDRDNLKFLWWRDNKCKELMTLRHCRVVFGVTSSPFLLAATISHHLNRASAEMKDTAQKLMKSFYVDNCVTSVESEADLKKFVREATTLLSSAHFNLRGWVSCPVSCPASGSSQEEVAPVLGMLWDLATDELYCNINVVSMSTERVTKRNLLSIAQAVFDPVGFTCPATLLPKLLLQETWKLGIGWDDGLPSALATQFVKWLRQLHWLSKCRVPRRLCSQNVNASDSSLHLFCDASKLSYAACAFLRTKDAGNVIVQLVEAKVRVAPLKQISIPRLELLGAVLAVRLFIHIRDSLELQHVKTYFWSDSSVVLAWIKTKGDWNTFVGNRCKEICQHSSIEDWKHIPGTMNPADFPSRGCGPKTLCRSKWWEGPRWLRGEPAEWPHSEAVADEEEVNSERRKGIACILTCETSKFSTCLLYFSRYKQIVRVVAWIFRFYNNLRPGNNVKQGELTGEDICQAEIALFRLVQSEEFQEGNVITSNKLQIFKDNSDLLRVKTKLTYSEENEEFKYPIVLPAGSPVVNRLISEVHQQSQHAGIQTLLSVLRERYWVVGGRRAAKSVIAKCIICKRFNAKPVDVPFAPLPKDRIGNTAVFEVSGVDYAGPLYLKTGEKAWVVLFTCAVYRAVHLELVQSISTQAFLMALRRFIARRGRVSVLYSDNGTNFVGAHHLLQKVNWDEIVSFSAIRKIIWKFNPPTAAWWGGWWERLIRMVKELLRRILGKASVYYEELNTILCDCEAVINARPLTYLAGDIDELHPLTPASFLQGITNSETTDLDAAEDMGIPQRWTYLKKLREDLRQRFRSEYLALLVQHGHRNARKIKVGDMVLIGDDGNRRINWPLGIVCEVYPGGDGIPRVAKVRTSVGEKVRPFQRLYPLEMDCPSELIEHTVQNVSPEVKKDNIVTTRLGRVIKVPSRLDW